jgi:SecD/SecF fusion protein
VADDIKKGAVWAIIFSVIGLGLYILLRFRDISFSVATIVVLIIDAVFILGCYAIFWGILPFSMEIDQTFIGAILTALGYSINDKVVVFDRIREYTHLYPKRDKLRLFDESLNTTLDRTINTGLSTLLVLIVIFVLAGETIRSFSFAMLLGVLGALSSLFLAAPLAYEIQVREERKKNQGIEPEKK